MNNYLISYDLNATGQNYNILIKAIKSYHNAVPVLKSVWFIQSSLSAVAIRDNLEQYIDNNDYLIVVEMAKGNSGVVVDESLIQKLSVYGFGIR